ncbi:unnamed protein product [Closterium sp. NIES-54]
MRQFSQLPAMPSPVEAPLPHIPLCPLTPPQSPILPTPQDRIDRAFMRQFSQLPIMPSPPLPTIPVAHTAGPEALLALKSIPMRCGGCGSKVGSSLLSRVLTRLAALPSRPPGRPEILLGLDSPDDAAVLAIPPDSTGGRQDPVVVQTVDFFRSFLWSNCCLPHFPSPYFQPPLSHQNPVIVQTVDFFRSFLSDPHTFGRIAALHALTDCFAMGADPVSALAIVTLPYGTEEKVSPVILFHTALWNRGEGERAVVLLSLAPVAATLLPSTLPPPCFSLAPSTLLLIPTPLLPAPLFSHQMEEELFQVMAGAIRELDAATCQLVGGHTVEGAELSLGFAVTGLADRDWLLRKVHECKQTATSVSTTLNHLLPKQQPLHCSTGPLLPPLLPIHYPLSTPLPAPPLHSKRHQKAAAIALQHKASAATDVTGFGLLGGLSTTMRISQYVYVTCLVYTHTTHGLPCVQAISCHHPDVSRIVPVSHPTCRSPLVPSHAIDRTSGGND